MIYLGIFPLTTKIDIWMLGCVVYFLIFRKHPFGDSGIKNIQDINFYDKIRHIEN